ncbi:DUF1203 domain-containing protein [Streptomyces sp. NPDC053560]|uniref:DUF1203 domain-containing protein n=1 Tax=Streptomyces sp. NPDC053560 TaxID=3365711 RepID=UPI0037CEFF8F
MATYSARPIDATALKELRTADDAGQPVLAYTAGGGDDPLGSVGSPLRCCLRPVRAGERVALVAYAPLRRWAAETGVEPGAYDEQGPVFVHAEECGGPAPDTAGYPFTRTGALRVLRRYTAAGHIAGGRLLELPEDADAALDAALDEAFADPGTALVHVRAVEYGCLHFEVRRP